MVQRRPLIDFKSAIPWIITVNILVFIFLNLALWFACSDETACINLFALNPSNILAGQDLWTIFTHMFVHISALHLFVNMFVLYSLGGLCEKIIGTKRFVWFYLISGVIAGIVAVLFAGQFGNSEIGARIFGASNIYMVGASGAIFAIAALFVMLLPRLRFSIIFLPFFSLPGYIMIPLVLFATWAISIAGNLPIGNTAHLGGFICGIVYGRYLCVRYKRKIFLIRRYIR